MMMATTPKTTTMIKADKWKPSMGLSNDIHSKESTISVKKWKSESTLPLQNSKRSAK